MSASEVGSEVLRARQEAGLTQQYLAEILGVHVIVQADEAE